MLHVSDLSKQIGDALLFEKVSFDLNAGERVGLVGPNGSGKTTMLRMLVGEEPLDSGSVRFDVPLSHVGYLPQALEFDAGATVREVLGGSTEDHEQAAAARLQALAEQLASAQGTALTALEEEYSQALDQLVQAGTALPEHEAERVLRGLDLDTVETTTLVRILSGGQKTRLGLARLLLAQPKVLLLDEPTNHLDIEGLEWLEEYLRTYDGALLVVSHDRAFLDRIVTGVLDLDPLTYQVRAYPGSYTDYAAAKEVEREKHWQAYREQEERIARLEGAVRQLEGQARRVESETIDFYWRKRARKIARGAVVRRRRIERMLDSEDHLEKPAQTWSMKLEFINTPPSGQDVLVLEELGKAYGELRLFAGVNATLRRGERTVIMGPNGVGKTTLLRIIAGVETPSEGIARLGSNVNVGYLAQEQETLDGDATPFEVVRRAAPLSETEARSFLHYFLFAGDDVFLPVANLSYGERSRLALGTLVLQGCNLLLLDEPTNHLDIPSREHFEQALSAFEGTILAVVHDRYFVNRLATSIWAIEAGTLHRYLDLEDWRRNQRLRESV